MKSLSRDTFQKWLNWLNTKRQPQFEHSISCLNSTSLQLIHNFRWFKINQIVYLRETLMKHEPDDVRKNSLHAVAVHYIGFRSAWIGYGLFVFINNLSVEEKQNQYRDNNRYDVGSPNLNNNNIFISTSPFWQTAMIFILPKHQTIQRLHRRWSLVLASELRKRPACKGTVCSRPTTSVVPPLQRTWQGHHISARFIHYQKKSNNQFVMVSAARINKNIWLPL